MKRFFKKTLDNKKLLGVLITLILVLSLPLLVQYLQQRTQSASHALVTIIGTPIYVNTTRGNDSNSGSQASPVKTIQKGINLANGLINSSQDVTVIIAPGVYREAVNFGSVTNSTKSLYLTAETGAILSGADQLTTGWSQLPDGVFVHEWSNKWGQKAISSGWEAYWDSDGKGFIRDRLRRYETFYVNDQPFFNRLSLSELDLPGTFFVDETNSKIYLRPYDPTNFLTSKIEYGARQPVLFINGRKNITITNLKIEKSKGALQDSMVTINNSSDITLDGVIVQLAAYTGFGSASTTRLTVKNSQFIDNGVMGEGEYHNRNTIFTDNLIARNNWRGWDASHPGWDSVHKWGANRDGSITRTDFTDNLGSGLWLDWDNVNISIENVFTARNKSNGFWIEANTGPVTIQNSISCQNENGLTTAYTDNLRLLNNQLFNNPNSQINWGGADQLLSFVQWDTGQTITLKSANHIWTGNTIVANDPQSKIITGPYGTNYLNGWRLSYKGDSNKWFHKTTTIVFSAGNNTDGKAALVDFPTWRTNNANYTENINKNNELNSVWADQGTLTCLKPGSPTDSAPPSINIVSPASGAPVTGIIPVSAIANDNTAVASIQFKIDGRDLGTPVTAKPYNTSFNSNSVSNSSHTLTAVAVDPFGNSTTSSPISVNVNNTVVADTYKDIVIKDSPVGYWRFEETSGLSVSDDSGNGKTGVVKNGGNLNSPGILSGSNSSITFDGIDDHIQLGLVHSSNSDDSWSWELWTNIEAVNQANSGLLGTGNNPRFTVEPDRKVQFATAFRDGIWAGGPITSALTTGVHHLVLTVTGATTNTPIAKIYVDGVEAVSKTYTKPINSPWSRGVEGALRINMRDSVFGAKGIYDEAAAYDFALSAASVKSHFDKGKAVVTADYNGDGTTDLLDFNLWRNEFLGLSTTTKSDSNGDGLIDLIDFNRWLTAFRSV